MKISPYVYAGIPFSKAPMRNANFMEKHKAVVSEICNLYGASWDDISSKSTRREHCNARILYSYIMTRNTNETLSRVAREINKTHTNVSGYRNTAKDLIAVDADFRNKFYYIEIKLFNNEQN